MTEFMFQKPNAPSERSTTISVSDRDLRAATQLLRALVASDEAQAAVDAEFQPSVSPGEIDQAKLAARARKIFSSRRRRGQIFGKGMFGEPAWDMLVALYMDDIAGPKATIGRLSEMTDTALTTAIRWLEYLEQQGLVRREPHPTDRRAMLVELTDKGRTAMDRFLSGTDL